MDILKPGGREASRCLSDESQIAVLDSEVSGIETLSLKMKMATLPGQINLRGPGSKRKCGSGENS